MNLQELTKEVQNDERVKELGFTASEVKVLVRVVIDQIGKGLIKHGIIKIRGLFTVKIKGAKGRRIGNPQTGEEMFSSGYKHFIIKPRNTWRIRGSYSKSRI